MKSARLSALITVLILSLLGGCSGPVSPAPPATPTPPGDFVTDTPAAPTLAATAPPTATAWFGDTPTPEAFVARARVTATCLNLRTEAEVGSVLVCMPSGTVVDVLDNGGTWWKVEVPFGPQGWAHSDWLEVIPQ